MLVLFGSIAVVRSRAVRINIVRGLNLVAYHAPHFESNIVANHFLSEHFDTVYTSVSSGEKCCYLYYRKDIRSQNILCKIKCKNYLHFISFSNNNVEQKCMQSTSSDPNLSDYNCWHKDVEHISSKRYQKLSKQEKTVKNFPTKYHRFSPLYSLYH